MDVLEGHLAGREWLVGEGMTIADTDIYGVVALAGEAGIDLAGYPQILAFTQRIEALPGFKARADLLPMESRAAA